MKGLSVHFFHFVRINAHNSIVSFISLYLYFDSLRQSGMEKTTKPVKTPATAARTIIPELILLHIFFVTEIKTVIEVTL